jgi:copper chaperone CopZ
MMKFAAGVFAAALAAASVSSAKETTATFKVSGWHCGGCANKTEKAVKAVKGVLAAKGEKGEAAAGTVTVTYDDAVAKTADIEGAITALHYKVEK